MKLPTGDSSNMDKHKDLKIKINSLSIPLHKSIHYRVVEELASDTPDENTSDRDNKSSSGVAMDALSEMVNDLKSGTDSVTNKSSSTTASHSSSTNDDILYKPLNFLERLMALAFRLAYLAQKRHESSVLDSHVDFSQYAPGSVVVSIPVHVTFTGSGTEESTKHAKVNNATQKVTDLTASESTEPLDPGTETKVISTVQIDWKSKPEMALLYFTGCISGHTELEWRLSYVHIMNDDLD